jgi:hypothetical protein
LLWKDFKRIGIDIYYVSGKEQTRSNQLYASISNWLRYKKVLWIIQRLIDQQYLKKFNKKIPTANIEGTTISVDIPEGLPFLGAKMNAAYFLMSDSGYQVIYRTTLSSVVNLNVFMQWVKIAASRDFFYGGSVLNFGKRDFVSGASLLLNQNTVEVIRSNIRKWNHANLDDVAIGKLLERKIKPTHIDSINISSIEEVDLIETQEFSSAIQVRCKSTSAARNDDLIMKSVLNKFPSIQRYIKTE